MRPKPLIPTRTVMITISFGGFQVPRASGPKTTLTNFDPVRQGPFGPGSAVQLRVAAALFVLEHVRAEIGLGIGYPQFSRPLVRSRQQASDPSGNSVFGQRWLVHLPELFQTCLLVLDAQHAGRPQMIRNIIAEYFQCTLDSRTSSYCRAS